MDDEIKQGLCLLGLRERLGSAYPKFTNRVARPRLDTSVFENCYAFRWVRLH